MSEYDVLVVVLWFIMVTVAVLAAADLLTVWIIREQQDQTPLGRTLRQNFLSLGVRHVVMVVFHFVLAYTVTVGEYPVGRTWRVALYIVIAATSAAAAYYAVQRVRDLARESRRER